MWKLGAMDEVSVGAVVIVNLDVPLIKLRELRTE